MGDRVADVPPLSPAEILALRALLVASRMRQRTTATRPLMLMAVVKAAGAREPREEPTRAAPTSPRSRPSSVPTAGVEVAVDVEPLEGAEIDPYEYDPTDRRGAP